MNKIKKTITDLEIVELNDEILYSCNKKGLKIDFYDEDSLDDYFDKNFNVKYREILYLIMNYNEDDESSPEDEELILSKIEDLKNRLLTKYSKYISKDRLNKYLKMIILLDSKIKVKERGMRR